MARFHYPGNMTAEEKSRVESNPFGPLPEGSNVNFCHEFFDKLEICETKYIDREKIYCLFEFLFPALDYSAGLPLQVTAKVLTIRQLSIFWPHSLNTTEKDSGNSSLMSVSKTQRKLRQKLS